MSDGKAEQLYYEYPCRTQAKPLKFWKRFYSNIDYALTMGILRKVEDIV
jgi:hypothetical protein